MAEMKRSQGESGLRVDAILLAAGAGTRFGGGKLRAIWRGRTLMEHALAAAAQSPIRSVTVVTGADPGVADLVEDYARRTGARVQVVHCADHAEGMGASLRRGVSALPSDCEAFAVFLGDMPAAPGDIVARLIERLDPEALAAAPCFQGRRGHPVLFRAALAPRLAEAAGDSGARAVLRGLDDRLVLVETGDPGVLFDVDLPRNLTESSV
jgi:molybdenum cofactor cytidylyltransferase